MRIRQEFHSDLVGIVVFRRIVYHICHFIFSTLLAYEQIGIKRCACVYAINIFSSASSPAETVETVIPAISVYWLPLLPKKRPPKRLKKQPQGRRRKRSQNHRSGSIGAQLFQVPFCRRVPWDADHGLHGDLRHADAGYRSGW